MATRVAVDAMGGDEAPSVVVEGALRAVEQSPEALQLFLVGPEERVREALRAAGEPEEADGPIQVVDAPEVIGMGEAPAAAVKRKKRSSIHVGLGMCKEGKAQAFASAGNTGAIMTASLFILGRLPGVDRPAAIGYVPTVEGSCLLLDVGTNLDCRPAHLEQFARMGAVYAQHAMGRSDPSVGLLNVGEEPGKGNEQVKAAYERIDAAPDLRFVGNVEGRDMLNHKADVVVCDGFIGNIVLKFGESIATSMLQHMVRREMEKQSLSREHQAVVKKVLRGVQEPFDYEAHGGTPLLGIDGNVLIGHGSSSTQAIERLILEAGDVARQGVAQNVSETFDALATAG